VTKPRKLFRPSFYRIFCLLVTTVFLFGLLPVPVLAQADGTIARQVTDNTTGNPIASAFIGAITAAIIVTGIVSWRLVIRVRA